MTYANILTLASGGEEDAVTLALAADLAVQHGAMARVLSIMPELWATPGGSWGEGFYAAEIWSALLDANAETQKKLLARANAIAREAGLPFGATEGPGLTMLDQALTLWRGLDSELPLTDLVVAGPWHVRRDGPWLGVLGEVVMSGHAPLLIARETKAPAGRPAVVFWDGSLEAGRAARAAAPLLRQASETLIVQQAARLDDAERDHSDPALLAAYLGRRGVEKASVVRTLSSGEDDLAVAAMSYQPGLLVAGAYGHSRLGESLFGGATRRFLAIEDGPSLLIAH